MANDISQPAERILLRCGRTVPAWLYNSVRAHVLKRADELDPCRPYTLKMICGKHYWNPLNVYKTHAGLIMAELVDLQLVPFLFASERDAKPLWYWLTP